MPRALFFFSQKSQGRRVECSKTGAFGLALALRNGRVLQHTPCLVSLRFTAIKTKERKGENTKRENGPRPLIAVKKKKKRAWNATDVGRRRFVVRPLSRRTSKDATDLMRIIRHWRADHSLSWGSRRALQPSEVTQTDAWRRTTMGSKETVDAAHQDTRKRIRKRKKKKKGCESLVKRETLFFCSTLFPSARWQGEGERPPERKRRKRRKKCGDVSAGLPRSSRAAASRTRAADGFRARRLDCRATVLNARTAV